MIKRRQALRSSKSLATSFFLSLILVFFFTLPSILVRAEPVSSGASASMGEADRVTPDDMNTGSLLLQTEDGGLVAAPRLAIDVVMAVNGTIARVTVTDQSLAVAPSDTDVGTAGQPYPLLPLTIVPKPDASSLAALRAAHDPSQRTTILALVLALLSAMTFIVWRHHRRDYASPRRIGRRI